MADPDATQSSADRTVELTVRSAEKRDAGRGIVRLPERARERLGVLSGDTVTIRGDRATVAQVWPAGGDLADDALRIDADTRANAGVTVGEAVAVQRAQVAEAAAVTLDVRAGVDADRETVRDAVERDLRDRPVRTGERVRVERLGGVPLRVGETDPDGTVRLTEETEITLRFPGGGDGAADESEGQADHPAGTGEPRQSDQSATTGDGRQADPVAAETPLAVSYEDIGGLDEELDLVRETVELPLADPEVFARVGIEAPKGVLLHGPPGTGKTLIARAVASEVDATFLHVSGPEVMSKFKGESEERLREVFERAREAAPAIVFFDEIDSLAPRREDGGGDVESRVVGQLLALMDGLEARGEVIVIGATNRPDAIDPALRRGGRFDREIEIGVPDERGRREILAVHTRGVPLAPDVDLDRLAARTHGFVGADLDALVTEAGMRALRRGRREGESLTAVTVTRDDVEGALAAVEPSAMRKYVAETTAVGFDDVGGHETAKRTLRRAVEWPLTHGPLFEAVGTAPPAGVLLHGPPGTGKTLLARAIAGESGVNFVHVAGPELLDRYVGESEKAVREVFERARQAAPAIVFFDEIDAVAGERGRANSEVGERVVSQLLTELDGLVDNPNLVVLAATNRKDALDPALLRPGRLEAHVEVPAPDEAGRRAVLAVHTREAPLAADVDLDEVAARTAGYSGADLAAVCREAAMRAVNDVASRYGEDANAHADEVEVTAADFEAALEAVAPSLSETAGAP
ncbi:MAG: AAA family ATPase [Haloferacaceae archaeon]